MGGHCAGFFGACRRELVGPRLAQRIGMSQQVRALGEGLRNDAEEFICGLHETFDLSRMSKLIYITSASLDGYVEDASGAFDWVNPDQVFAFITELLRPIGAVLLGRRLYETMAFWDAPVEDYPPEHRDFARVWQKPEKIVFSRTLGAAKHNTRVEREFDFEAIRKLKRESEHDIDHWRRRACGACDRSRPRRRMSPVSQPGDRRRRKAGIPSRLTTESRTP